MNDSPIIMDSSPLRELGGAYSERSYELDYLFERWMLANRSRLVDYPNYKTYLKIYGEFSPLTILPLAMGVSDHFHDVNRIAKLAVTRRLIVTDIQGESREFEGTRFDNKKLRFRKLIGNDYLRAPLNESPVNKKRFSRLMQHSLGVFQSIVDRWESLHRSARKVGSQNDISHPQPPYTFVSYSRKDEPRVSNICREIQNRGQRIWFDTQSIEGGEDYVNSIVAALDGCSSVLAFCSNNHSNSNWCYREILYADEIGKKTIPMWLTNPALFKKMKFLLGPLQAIIVEGLSDGRAADRIAGTL